MKGRPGGGLLDLSVSVEPGCQAIGQPDGDGLFPAAYGFTILDNPRLVKFIFVIFLTYRELLYFNNRLMIVKREYYPNIMILYEYKRHILLFIYVYFMLDY